MNPMLTLLALLFGLVAGQTCEDVNCVTDGLCGTAEGCQNGGICRNATVYSCDCSNTGFQGPTCEEAITTTPAPTTTTTTTTVAPEWGPWGPCNKGCGYGEQARFCEPVGAVCPDDAEGGGVRPCNEFPCVNCEFSYGRWSACSQSCNGGTQSRSNDIRKPGTPGANVTCPPLYEERECNTRMCYAEIVGIGYRFWKVTGPTLFTYKVGSVTNRAMDVFMFREGADWDAYRRDVSRNKMARNYGYTPAVADVDTENTHGSFSVPADSTYYFVVDYSYVGDAQEKPDEWTTMRFTYELGGCAGGDCGEGENTGSRIFTSPLSHLVGLGLLLFLL